jgi:DNA-binding NtrC family response regulator
MAFEESTEKAAPRKRSSRPDRTLIRVFSPSAGAVPESERVVLARSPLIIGRTEGAQTWVVPDSRVSRRHAEIEPLPDRTLLRDTSSNGTFVNGVRISEVDLADGDVIRVGDSLIVFRLAPRETRDASFPALIGRAPSMQLLRATIALAAPADVPVLVLGESGTGKELVAAALHEASARSGPFVAVNCAAIPETLAESQLFGHVSGSFTGARGDHPGVMRQAHQGTLFLDEIGEMPITLQPKLLRAVEERAVTPVGASRSFPAQARIVAATHRDLEDRVEAGTFRGDLYARLAGIVLRTPPLRERREDVLDLLRRELGPAAPPLDPELAEALLVHAWPFNVRELFKVAAELRIRGTGAATLDLSMVESRLRIPFREVPVGESDDGDDLAARTVRPRAAPDDETDRDEGAAAAKLPPPSREQIETALAAHGRNVSALSRALGRSRRQIRRYLAQLGIAPEE